MILITGAGTGGHVLSALSVYNELKKLFPYKKFLFVGSYNLQKGKGKDPSIEEVICKRYNVPFVKIRTGKVQRYIEPRTFKLLGFIPLGFIDAIRLVRRVKAEAIIAFGGFTTPPLVFAGRLFGVPTFIHEQTTSVGLANKVASLSADHIIVAFKQAQETFPKKVRHKIVHLGYPVRKEIFQISSYKDLMRKFPELKTQLDKPYLEALKHLEKPKKPVLTIVTGGTGSLTILKNVLEALDILAKQYTLIVQTGDLPIFNDLQRAVQNLRVQIKPLITKFMYEELGFVLNNSSVVVSRSGAGFVYQLGMLQKKAVLIPLPFARGNEQYRNALILKRLGLAIILPQAKLNPKSLINTIGRIRKKKLISKNIQQAKNLFPMNAAEEIARYISMHIE